MAEKKKWMQEAFKGAHGQLRKKAGAKAGKPIAAGKLEKLTHSQSTKTKRQAVLAETARRVRRK
jgi:hypothetical protein